jgi:hypothetical protein
VKVIKLDRRYSQCRFNDYWLALHFDIDQYPNQYLYQIKDKLQDYYGPSYYAMFNNPAPWYVDYTGKNKETIYLRDESMLTMLHLSGALNENN